MGVKERTELECSKANAFFLSPLLPSVPVVVTVLAWAGCSGSWATRVATSLPVVGTDAAATTPVVGRMPPGSRAAAVPVAVVTIPVAVAVPLAPAVPVAAVGVAVAVTVVASVRVPVAVSVRRRAVGFASRVAARAAVSHVLSGSGSMSAVGDGEVDTDAASIEFLERDVRMRSTIQPCWKLTTPFSCSMQRVASSVVAISMNPNPRERSD